MEKRLDYKGGIERFLWLGEWWRKERGGNVTLVEWRCCFLSLSLFSGALGYHHVYLLYEYFYLLIYLLIYLFWNFCFSVFEILAKNIHRTN